MTNDEVGARLKLAIEGTLEMTGACLNKVLMEHVKNDNLAVDFAETIFNEVVAEVNVVIEEANRINARDKADSILAANLQ